MAIVITGCPGVGKHTVAKEVGEMRGMDVLDINQVATVSGMAEEVDGEIEVDVERLGDYMADIAKDVLVVGHLAPHVMSREQVETAVVLRKNPYKLDHIYRARGYPEAKRIENQGSEILGVVMYDSITKFGREKTIQVDTSSRSVRETAGIVNEVISGKVPDDRIDWLEMVSSAGDIGRFFPTAKQSDVT